MRHIRFTEEQVKRLHRVTRSQGETIQSFSLRAIMAAVAEVEEELRAGKERKRRVERDEEAAILSLSNEPQGLGIRTRMEREEAKKAERAQAIAPTPTIVINNGPVAGGAMTGYEASLAKLAAHVASVPRWSRAQRATKLQKAVEMLQMLADTDEERQALARRLDELVAKADRMARQGSKGALDQILDLLGG